MNENQVLTTTQPLSPPAMLERAIQSGVSVEVLEKLMGLEERWRANEAKRAFNAAMSDMRETLPPIVKNQKVDFTTSRGRTNYKYEDLNDVVEVLSPHMAKFGLAFRWRTQPGDPVTVTCIVAHRDGYSEESSLSAPRDESGNKNVIQGLGSAITYLQRYTLKAALGIAAAPDDDGRSVGEAGTRQPAQRHQPANKTPENTVSAPKQATEATRHWMFENLQQFKDSKLLAFFISKGWMKDGDLLVDLNLQHVPTNRAQLGELIREIDQFIERNAPPSDAAASDLPSFTEPFWDTVVTLPRKGSKRAEYLKNPDTIKSLYVATKSGDDFARERLFGIVGHWEPADWQDNTGKMRPPSKADVDCRAALDAFKEWHDEKEKQGQFADLVP